MRIMKAVFVWLCIKLCPFLATSYWFVASETNTFQFIVSTSLMRICFYLYVIHGHQLYTEILIPWQMSKNSSFASCVEKRKKGCQCGGKWIQGVCNNRSNRWEQFNLLESTMETTFFIYFSCMLNNKSEFDRGVSNASRFFFLSTPK